MEPSSFVRAWVCGPWAGWHISWMFLRALGAVLQRGSDLQSSLVGNGAASGPLATPVACAPRSTVVARFAHLVRALQSRLLHCREYSAKGIQHTSDDLKDLMYDAGRLIPAPRVMAVSQAPS